MILIPPLHDYAVSHHCCHKVWWQNTMVWGLEDNKNEMPAWFRWISSYLGGIDGLQGNLGEPNWHLGRGKTQGMVFSLESIPPKCRRGEMCEKISWGKVGSPEWKRGCELSWDLLCLSAHTHTQLHTHIHTYINPIFSIMHMYYILYIPQSSLLSVEQCLKKNRLLRSLGRCHHGKMKWNCFIMKHTICGTAFLWNLHLCQCQANLKLGDL